MKIFAQVKHLLLGRVESSFFEENRDELRTTNYRLLRTACIFSSAMCLFLLCLTLLNSLISELTFFYLFYTLFFSVLTVLVLTVANRHRRWIPFFFYLFASAVFVLVIDAGTRITPGLPAVTFHVFLLIIPILFVTRPMNAVLLSVIACAVFCGVTAVVKGPGSYLAQTDMLNAISCCIVGIGLDITIINLQLENIKGKAYFRHQSATDELTGLPNRRSFDLYVEQLFQECLDSGTDLCLIMMDIDGFKAYNDAYGHIQGDECLRKVSDVLIRTSRQKNMFLARFGGEEFVAVVDHLEASSSENAAKEFVESIEKLKIPHCKSPSNCVTLSAGYASLLEAKAKEYKKLLDCADDALYTAKAAGKNCARPWRAE